MIVDVHLHLSEELREWLFRLGKQLMATIQDLAKALSDADAEADKAITRVQVTVDKLSTQISSLEAQLAQAGAGGTQPMIDQIATLKAKLAALDPTELSVLP